MAKKQQFLKTADSVIEQNLDARVDDLEGVLGSHVIAVFGPINYGIEDLIRDAVEYRVGLPATKKKKLAVVLETTGGYIEVTQRIVQVLRNHYREVEFVVPNYAMSAGTVLALSGDAIHMDYFSILGPIDPQVRKGDAGFVPALGYLEYYNRLIEKSKAGTLTTAEMSFLVAKFNPAELYAFEQARNLSISLLKEWLVKYKFKNWKVTKKRKVKVNKKLRTDTAEKIARLLNETQEWHSHGRGISMDVLRRKVGLEIDDFGNTPQLREAIRTYYELMQHYMMRRGQGGVVHVSGKYIPLA